MRLAHLSGAAALSLALVAPTLPAAATTYADGGAVPARTQSFGDLAGSSQPSVTLRRDQHGQAHYLGATAGHVLAHGTHTVGAAASARTHLGRYAREFGIAAPARDLRTSSVRELSKGQAVVRFQQTAGGLPVFGGQLTTVLDGANNLLSITGETSPTVRSAAFAVSAGAARAAALRVTATATGLPTRRLTTGTPARWLYDPSLFDEKAAAGSRAVWRVEVTAPRLLDVRELVLVDASTGAVSLHVSEVEHADRVVCDNGGRRNDEYLCDKTHYRRSEASAPSTVGDVEYAFLNTGAASDFFASLGVDLTGLIGSNYGDGQKLRSTVRVCPASGTCPYDNAFWDGFQMVYGGGFPKADDVVAHELSHGVTQHTSGLIYWRQSGAINESMSDVFGELVDLSDGIGNDDPSVRWQLGEDLPVSTDDLQRNLASPTSHGQPDRVRGPNWTETDSDNGGVHTNSGVGNKAAYLITDGTVGEPGGAFNGQIIPAGLGVAKAAQIYWLTEQMLTPGSDYGDLANTLYAACAGLAAGGVAGITATDCTDVVQKATLATQMQAFSGPQPPQVVRVQGGYKQIHVTWQPPAASGTAPVNSYVLIVSPSIQGENFLPIDDAGATDVRIGGIPSGRTFTFSLMSVTSDGNSTPVSVTLQGTRSTLTARKSVRSHAHVKVTGKLTLASGAGVGSRKVTLYRKLAGKHSWRKVATKATNRHGLAVFRPRQKVRTRYYLLYKSQVSGLMGSRSGKQVVSIRRHR